MNKCKPNLPLVIGLLMYCTTRFWDIPGIMGSVLLVCALILELWGVILITRSPAINNSKLRRWKMRLISRFIGHAPQNNT